jgi:hypothetical protein
VSLFDALRYRLRAIVHRGRVARELDEELRFHLELEAMQRRHAGAEAEEARFAALRRFGNRTRVGEEIRDASLRGRLDPIVQDLRYAARGLRRNPGFATVAVLTLTLGIGASSAIFSVVNGVLLRPLPFVEPERLVRIFTADEGGDRDYTSPPNFMALREQRRVFADVAAFDYSTPTLTEAGDARKLEGAQVSAGFFEVLGARPVLGRTFRAEENQPGSDAVAVLGNGLWQQLFGGSADVLGKTVTLDGVRRTVVGVMPAGFGYPEDCVVWTPLRYNETYVADSRAGRGADWLWLLARLEPGVTVEEASSAVRTVAGRLEAEFPESHAGVSFAVVGLQDQIVDEVRTPLLLLLGAVGLLLLIACANVAGLLLARAAARHAELTVRAALGAGRGRLVRQLLAESLLLAGVGGLCGLLLAVWGTAALVAARPEGLPRLDGIHVGGTIVTFTLGVTLLTTVLVGLVPALQATRGTLAATIRGAGRSGRETRSGSRLRSGLVVAESVARPRFLAMLLALFAATALALAAIGIFGLLSYTVAQRTREIGVRIALGARPGDVLGMVVRRALRLAGLGLTLGVLAALALTRVLEGILYGVSPTDPATFAGVALVLGATALMASLIPARRASAVDPVIALRHE